MSLLFHWINDHKVFIYIGEIIFLGLSRKTTSFVSLEKISLEMNSRSGA